MADKTLQRIMQSSDKNYISKFIFNLFELMLTVVPWILLIIAIVILLRFDNCLCMHNLALSYIAGMVVYAMTVFIPDIIKDIKLKRRIISDLARLYSEYRGLLWTISKKTPETNPFSQEQILLGLEQLNCRRKPDYICLSAKTIGIITPQCRRILDITSQILSKHYAFSVDELLVIHEITQVWFLKDVSKLNPEYDYWQTKAELMEKVEYLILRYNDLHDLYFKIKRRTSLTVGWHPSGKIKGVKR